MGSHPEFYVRLAIQAIRHYLAEGVPPPCPSKLPDGMNRKSGVFVSIKKRKNHELRGCIGTVTPTQKNLAEEIIHNAISAATRDPRFEAISTNELDSLEFSVDVLTPLEAIKDASELDPKRYGLSIRYEKQQGILLPDLEGIDTAERQIELCLKKGNIPKDCSYQMYRFGVERYK
jgi:AmmeMemoRadiSam system protein A